MPVSDCCCVFVAVGYDSLTATVFSAVISGTQTLTTFYLLNSISADMTLDSLNANPQCQTS